MFNFFLICKKQIILWLFIIAYIVYFSYFTILRYKTLYASYYDLGIMHQTVFNTYSALKTGDWSRFLELTNPAGPEQIKRMAIHNDILLIIPAIFYFIFSGPETLLVMQTVITALGAIGVFKIAKFVLGKNKYADFLSLIFSLAFLLYPPLERANIFDFHAVTLATTLLLFMFYFWLKKKLLFSFLFFLLSIFSKEQVALTTLFFALYIFTTTLCSGVVKKGIEVKKNLTFASTLFFLSISWFIFSLFYIIPLTRGGGHFATVRYSDFGESPIGIITGVILGPLNVLKYVLRKETFNYFINLLGPTGFLSLLSPSQFLIVLPELAINLLSKNPNMRNIIYHYTAVITPFVFISSIYGVNNLINLKTQNAKTKTSAQIVKLTLLVLSISTLYFACFKGPLPFSKSKNIHPFKYPQKEAKDTAFWAKTLRDENLKISTTGQLSSFFTARRYFYIFSARYRMADYVIIRLNEIYNYPEKNELIPVYEKLIGDENYDLIYQKENFEVYKRKLKS